MTLGQAIAEIRTSAAVARLLGVPYFRLHYLVRAGKIPEPARDSAGRYLWLPSDISRAAGLLGRPGPHLPPRT